MVVVSSILVIVSPHKDAVSDTSTQERHRFEPVSHSVYCSTTPHYHALTSILYILAIDPVVLSQ